MLGELLIHSRDWAASFYSNIITGNLLQEFQLLNTFHWSALNCRDSKNQLFIQILDTSILPQCHDGFICLPWRKATTLSYLQEFNTMNANPIQITSTTEGSNNSFDFHYKPECLVMREANNFLQILVGLVEKYRMISELTMSHSSPLSPDGARYQTRLSGVTTNTILKPFIVHFYMPAILLHTMASCEASIPPLRSQCSFCRTITM